jgi:hypothetical protein
MIAMNYPNTVQPILILSKGWGEYGKLVSFLDGWIMMIVVIIDQAIYPIIFRSYLAQVIKLNFWYGYLADIIFVFICFIINVIGVRGVGKQNYLF